jgi:4-hydroxy-tetrahydrodipicolinate synthase
VLEGKIMTAKTLSGVIAAVATPIDESGAPDLKRAVKLARYLLDNGCDGLNVLGTTGEATSFSLDERKAVMDAYKTNGLPLHRLMVGTGAAAVSDAVALTRHAAELGFAGALVLPPFYYKGVSDDGVFASAHEARPAYLEIKETAQDTAVKEVQAFKFELICEMAPGVIGKAQKS